MTFLNLFDDLVRAWLPMTDYLLPALALSVPFLTFKVIHMLVGST